MSGTPSGAHGSARATVLALVRDALADVPAGEGPADVAVARDYRDRFGDPSGELAERFAERVADYNARIRRVEPGGEAAAIAATCVERGASRLVVPPGLPPGWRPPGVEFLLDVDFNPAQLDRVDGVLTGCALGIAETGTIVLDGGPLQGRRAITLVPDLHLCVVRTEQIVGGVPEALARLEPAVRDAGRPITFISGPSATSDIELERVEGVHGPRLLDVLIVG